MGQAAIPYIVSAVATIGGTYMQNKSRNDAQERQRKAAMAEALRQGEMDEDKFKSFQQALAEVGRGEQQETLDNAAAEIESKIGANVSNPNAGSYESPAASNAPKVVQQYGDDRQSEADDFVSLLGNARARRGAWGENQYRFNQNLMENLWQQGQLQKNMDRSAQIGLMEADFAGQERGPGAAIGNALVGLGTSGFGYAASKAPLGSLFTSGSNVPVVTSVPSVVNNAQSFGLGAGWNKKFTGTPII